MHLEWNKCIFDIFYRSGGLDIFDSYFNGRNMYRALHYWKTSETDIIKFLKRVEKYLYRINYDHFQQFSKRLETLSFHEYAAFKRRYNAPITNLMIGHFAL